MLVISRGIFWFEHFPSFVDSSYTLPLLSAQEYYPSQKSGLRGRPDKFREGMSVWGLSLSDGVSCAWLNLPERQFHAESMLDIRCGTRENEHIFSLHLLTVFLLSSNTSQLLITGTKSWARLIFLWSPFQIRSKSRTGSALGGLICSV